MLLTLCSQRYDIFMWGTSDGVELSMASMMQSLQSEQARLRPFSGVNRVIWPEEIAHTEQRELFLTII